MEGADESVIVGEIDRGHFPYAELALDPVVVRQGGGETADGVTHLRPFSSSNQLNTMTSSLLSLAAWPIIRNRPSRPTE